MKILNRHEARGDELGNDFLPSGPRKAILEVV